MSDTHTAPLPQTLEQIKAAQPKPALPANAMSLRRADSSMRDFLATIPAGHRVEDILETTYWAHWARSLMVFGRIDAVAVDGSFDLTLRVVAKGDTWAKMRVLREWYPKDPEEHLKDPTPESAKYKVVHMGGGQWGVKSETGHYLFKGFASRDEAAKALAHHLETVKTIQ